MLDLEADRQQMVEALAKEKAKSTPNPEILKLIERRIEFIDLVEASRPDENGDFDPGFRWMLEVMLGDSPQPTVLKTHLIELQAGDKKTAIKESKKVLKNFLGVQRSRLYQVDLIKQFRPEEYK